MAALQAFQYRRFPLPAFIPLFYTGYALIVLAGNLVIAYSGISFIAALLFAAYVGAISVGAMIGYSLSLPRMRIIPLVSSRTFQNWAFAIGCIAAGLLWLNMIARYGSLSYIFAHAYSIRNSALEGQGEAGPILINYFSGLAYSALAVSLARYGHFGLRRDLLFIGGSFLLVVLLDLRLFGRNGIVYAIFCVTAFFLIFRVRIFTLRNLILVICLFAILMAPRLIRGGFDNFSGTVNTMTWALRRPLPESLNSVLSAYIYYFSSPYAFSQYIAHGGLVEPHTFGFRTFTPLVRLVNRLLGIGYVSTIDEFVFVPFTFNVYTIVRDFFQDFGSGGITVVPFVAGAMLGICFRWRGVFQDALKTLLLAWLLFSPVYNIFSSSTQMIGVIVVFAACFVWKPDKATGKKHTRKMAARSPAAQHAVSG